MNGLGGLIVIALVYFVMWILSNASKQGQEKTAAELQRKVAAAQQQGTAGRAGPKKKYRQIEEFSNKAGDAFVPATAIPSPLRTRESVFDEQIDGVSDHFANNAPAAQQISEHANPIAREIMAMMTTPQSMQQVVILNEIFNRPKSVME